MMTVKKYYQKLICDWVIDMNKSNIAFVIK